jgi:hypothetical protein
MILHHGWRSSASRRVRLCLEEKGLAYESHHVDKQSLSTDEEIAPHEVTAKKHPRVAEWRAKIHAAGSVAPLTLWERSGRIEDAIRVRG